MAESSYNPTPVPPGRLSPGQRLSLWIVFGGFGLSGAAALIYEVVWTRSLSTVMGSSTYAVSTMLAAFMAGLCVGGWLGSVLAPRVRNLRLAFALAELGIGLTGAAILPLISAATPVFIKSFYSFHLSFNSFSAVQFFLVFSIMAVPTTLMGMTFPLVVKLFADHTGDAGRQSGRLYGINTLGAIFGSIGAGFFLIPRIGLTGTALLAASLNILTASAILLLSGRAARGALAASAGAVALLVVGAASRPGLPFFSYYSAFRYSSADMVQKLMQVLDDPTKRQVVYHHQGLEGEVALIRYRLHNYGFDQALVNNGKWEAGDDRGFALLAYLPFFSYAEGLPQRVLNIGLGSGRTLTHLAGFPFRQIDSVELSEGILEVNRLHLSPQLFTDPRIRHIQADGRTYLMLADQPYDIIVASPSWAVENSSGNLLTDEFFALTASRLSPGGVFALWVDYFMMGHDDLEVLARTFAGHFGHSVGWQIDGEFIVLLGSNQPFEHSLEAVARAVYTRRPELRGSFDVAMTEEMIARISPGPRNTDDRPSIEFSNARNLITWRTGI